MPNKVQPMTDKNIDFRFEDIPRSYVFCFLDCPQSGRCILHRAGEKVPAGTQYGPAVYPTARQGDRCTMFKEYRVIHGAYGFDRLFAQVLATDIASLRADVKNYLGGNGTYSRYKLGRRILTPEQQRDILSIFHRYGYTTVTQFDHYVDVVEF